MEPTIEQIARVDLIHRRVDEVCAQAKAGHVITECVALHPGEHGAAEPMIWTANELELWSGSAKEALVRKVMANAEYGFALWHGAKEFLVGSHENRVDPIFVNDVKRGRIAYRKSAIVLATYPLVDRYASNRAGEEEIERAMRELGHHSAPIAATAKAFPGPGRNPR